MDEAGTPEEMQRRLTANQLAPGEVIRLALVGSTATSDVDLAGEILDALQRHYELRPR